MKQCSIKEVFG